MFCRLKNRCSMEVTMLQTIFQEEAERYPLAAPHLMYERVLPSMRKWRRSTQPAVPGTLPEYSGHWQHILCLPNAFGIKGVGVGRQPEPETVLSDYEPALQGALREVTDAPLQGCYFHFLQALVKRGRQEHVPMRLVRLYATLALLPAERAPAAFAALPDAAMFLQIPLNHAYHLYFRDYWMNIIRPETFSVYQKSHRTSNTAESFHAYLKKMLGASPNIWRFTHLTSIYFQIFSFSTGSRRARGIAAKVCRVRIAAAGQSRRSLFTAEARPPGVLVKQNVVACNLEGLSLRANHHARSFE
ncbi:uncharacterized protein [Choristoneura fumiferana]|uniref:uncharacterized protein n=1 Tax=Choristoneura fumiferana TaxID=7141 RepID=UPI003D154A9D